MKILKLEFENINAYKKHYVLDFTDPEFDDNNNQFVICGETAAGKTTILDVITLALYGKTPRQETMKGTDNEVMNRNCGFCSAAITYSCDSGVYTSRFYQHRANKSPKGALQSPDCEIIEIIDEKTTKVIQKGSNAKDMAAKNEEHIGLSYEQFIRAVLIPQGAFTLFLKSDDREKAAILAKVSGTEHYKKIGENIRELCDQVSKDYELLNQQFEGIEVLSPEDVASANAELDTLTKDVEAAGKDITDLQTKIDWRKRSDEVDQELTKAKNDLKVAEEEEKNFAAEREVLEKAEKAERCNEAYGKLETLKQSDATDKKDLGEAEEAIPELEKAKRDAEELVKTCQKDLEETEKQEEEKRKLWTEVRALDVRIEGCEKAVSEKASIVARANDQLRQKQELIKELDQKIADLTGKVKTAQDYIRDNAKDADLGSKISVLKVNLDLLKEAIGKEKEELDLAAAGKIDLEKAKAEQKEQADRINELYGELHQLVDQDLAVIAGILSEGLKDGCSCPVCGKVYYADQAEEHVHDETPSGGEEEHVRDVISSEENTEKNKEAKKEVSINVVDISDKIKEAEKKHQEAENEVVQLEKSIQDAENNAKSEGEKKNKLIGEINEAVKHWGLVLDTSAEGLKDSADKIIEILQKKADEYDKTKENLAEDEKALEGAKATRKGINLALAESDVRSAKAACDEVSEILSNLRSQRKGLFGDQKVADAEKALEMELKASREALNKARQSETKAAGDLRDQKTKKDLAEKRIEQRKTEMEEAEKRLLDMLQKNGFATEQEYLAAHRDEEEITSGRARRKKIDDALLTCGEKVKAAEEKRAKTDQEEVRTEKQLTELETEKDDAQKRFKVASVKTGEIRNKLTANEEQKKKKDELSVSLKDSLEKKELYDNIQKMVGKQDGSDFETFVQTIAMNNLIITANKYMESLQPNYKLVVEPGTMNIEISEDDVVRPISNTSGGESFLISLALAMAMSELAGKKGKVGALFLDEGFGSLSGDPLRDAIDSLKQMGSSGMLLGIITHVQTVIDEFSLKLEAKKLKNQTFLSGPGVHLADE